MKPDISVIIPVLNEASTINRSLDCLLSSTYSGGMEVIVVDGSPRGETVKAIRNNAVKQFISRHGRSYQMNEGAMNADGKTLLFLHADTELPPNALNAIASVMKEGEFVGGAFDLGINSDKPAFRLIERAASFRSRITRIPYGDQAIFIGKAYFQASGGFREIPLMEDVEFMRRIRKAGGRICIVPERVKTSARRWEKEGILYCTLRNWLLRALYSAGVSPERLASFYR